MKQIVEVILALLLADIATVDVSELMVEKPVVEMAWQSPCSSSSVKTYMDYKAITNKSSKQYKYIQKHMSIKDGLLYDKDGYMGVALGSWWGGIGSKWTIQLDTGNTLKVVKIDEKADRHVNNGCQHKRDGSVIEMVIDTKSVPSKWRGSNGYVFNGNFNNSKLFKGKILRVAKQ